MFFDILPLPILWLWFYVAGWSLSRRCLRTRCFVHALLSLLLLFTVVDAPAWVLFVSIGATSVLAGRLVTRCPGPRLRALVFALSVSATALMIIAFLSLRAPFQRYFLGIPSLSYLGFRSIAFLTSAYRRRDVDLSAGLMQTFFFPILFMGPISRVEDFEKETWDYADVLRRLVFGFGMLIAARFCSEYVVDATRATEIVASGRSTLWLGALANSWEFYLSFAGYSHLIIGLGLLIGFKLPENFKMPYVATSVSDFWRRWHMSLSLWIRDYVYIPLGGSRKGTLRKCLNLLLAMTVCGLWHGLEVHYLVWGLFHGTILSLETLAVASGLRPMERLAPIVRTPLRIATTFSVVTVGWLIFKYPLDVFLAYLRGMFT